jgi:alpha-maltose-1-phosphate synthase
MEVDVRAFGNQLMDAPNLKVRGFPVDTSKFGCPKNLQSIFGAVRRCLDFNARRDRCGRGSHCHTWTWYTQLGRNPGQAKLRHPAGDHDPLA